MADSNRLYPAIQSEELDSPRASSNEADKTPKFYQVNDFGLNEDPKEDTPSLLNAEFSSLQISQTEESNRSMIDSSTDKKQGKYFYYDTPLHEETGIWIPISVPPLSESDHEEWNRGFSTNGAYFPEGEFSWDQLMGEDKEMTMWDVFSEMLLAARCKVSSHTIGEFRRGTVSFISAHLLEQAWNEMANSLSEANFENVKEILDMEPPRWLADSAASSCMLCGVHFHPIMCSRHHCRLCGGLFCGQCSRGRSLMPPKFRLVDPQRVCDVCCVRLESVQPYLMDQVSRASQLPTHDLTDLSTLRSWLNFPWGQSMEYEIYKAANIIRGYSKVGSLRPEKSIPEAILKQAKGLAILTVAKVGLMVTYNVGTGLVIARREDGSWSPPSAISSFGLGWGAQAGGEFTDFIIVLRTKDAIRTFSGNAHISLGAGVSAAAGIVGRAAEADIRAGDGGYAACYTYSCSKAEMNIEVHFGGQFLFLQGLKQYVGGSCKEITDFETDRMSWFELRYMLKGLGVISDYKVHCLRPRESLDSGLEAVFSDNCVMRILNYLDKDQNIVLYIEHLLPGSDKEKLPDYCLPGKDDPSNVVPSVIGGGLNEGASGVQAETAKRGRVKLTVVRQVVPETGFTFTKVLAHKDPKVIRRSPRSLKAKNLQFRPPSSAARPITTARDSSKELTRTVARDSLRDLTRTAARDSSRVGPTFVASTPTSTPRKIPNSEANTPTSASTDGATLVASTQKTPRKAPTSEASIPTSASSDGATLVARGQRTPRKAPTSEAITPQTPTSATQTSTAPSSVGYTILRRSPRLNKGINDDSWRDYMFFVEEDFNEEAGDTSKAAGDTSKAAGEASKDVGDTSKAADEASKYAGDTSKDAGEPNADAASFNSDKDSEYQPSSSLHSDTSLEDEDFTSQPRYPQFREDRDLTNDEGFCFEVGLQFQSPNEFRRAIRHHAIVKGFDLFWQKNEGVRINVRCKADGCPFKLYCSWNSDKTRYIVKSFVAEHTCGRPLKNTQLTKRWIANKYLEHYRSDPNLKWQLLKDMVQRDVGISISQHTCYRVRNIALEEIQGRNNDQYEKLWDYAHALLKHNPGSYVKVKTRPIPNHSDQVQFEAFFVIFAAMIKGLLSGCRPVLGMDGCHLKSSNGGILLSAVSRDPNNQMYPVGYAVVEVENKDTWTWFISSLLESLGVQNVQGWTFICDRQKGLVESLKLLVPRADVRFCCRHLYANFKEKFKGLVLKKLLWKAASSFTVQGHLEAMDEIKDIRLEAFNYLDGIDKQLWARSYFSQTSKCDLLVNNMCESFNKFILEARDKPIVTMLEMVRRQLMRRFGKKRQSAEKITTFGAKILEKLKEMEKGSRQCQPYQAGPDLFEVVEKGNHVVVDLKSQTCSCNQWQLTGIPCRHSICCIQFLRKKAEDYVHEFYSKDRYRAAYREIIYPLPDQSTWDKQNLLKIVPPKFKKQPGRPKKLRRKDADEIQGKQKLPRTGQVKTCSKCKEFGHNARGCKSTEVNTAHNVPTSRKRGRPRITPIEIGECSTGSKRGRKKAKTTEVGASSQQGSSITAMQQ